LRRTKDALRDEPAGLPVAEGFRRFHHATAHRPIPPFGPSIAAPQASDDAVLPAFLPSHAAIAAPTDNPEVAIEGDAVPGLLMRPQRGEANLAMQPFQLFHRLAATQQEPTTAGRELRVQFAQCLRHELRMDWIPLGRTEELGFVQVEPEDRTVRCRFRQRRMIPDAKVALEPHDLPRHRCCCGPRVHKGRTPCRLFGLVPDASRARVCSQNGKNPDAASGQRSSSQRRRHQ
jgi:hypothetical protein